MKAFNVARSAWVAITIVSCIGCGDNDITAPATPSPLPTATPTPQALVGPTVTFFGIARADDTLVPASGTNEEGVPVYERTFGSGFSLVIEGRPGSNDLPVGTSAFETDVQAFPDLQIQSNRDLGDGNVQVCEASDIPLSGIPAIAPPSFEATQANVDALNDFGCRFQNGLGAPVGRPESEACVQFESGEFGFVDPASTIQFCGFVSQRFAFPPGDTLLTARLRDQRGNPGSAAQIIFRVQP
jgi:hypothetical protein